MEMENAEALGEGVVGDVDAVEEGGGDVEEG